MKPVYTIKKNNRISILAVENGLVNYNCVKFATPLQIKRLSEKIDVPAAARNQHWNRMMKTIEKGSFYNLGLQGEHL
jgi:hypothetical protein